MPVLQGIYGSPISGLVFPMVTASGTAATGYDTQYLSGCISKDGGAWAALGGRISGITANSQCGWYVITDLSSTTETQCYNWAIKVTANSGCLPQTLLGQNLSGPAKTTDVSGLAGVVANTSNIIAQTSSVLTAVSQGFNAGVNVNISSMAFQVWNTLLADATSTPTFGGSVGRSGGYATVSGLNGLLVAVSGMPGIMTQASSITASAFADTLLGSYPGPYWIADINTVGGHLYKLSNLAANLQVATEIDLLKTLVAVSGLKNDVSGLTGILTAISGLTVDVSGMRGIYLNTSGLALKTNVSGMDGILVATSGVPAGVGGWNTADSATLVSGTIAEDLRRLRWFAWENLVIDKRWTPNRLYLKTDNTNTSSYFNLTDDSDTTNRARGG